MIRWGLTLVGGSLMTAGDLSIAVNMTGAAISTLMIMWSLWQKWQMHHQEYITEHPMSRGRIPDPLPELPPEDV